MTHSADWLKERALRFEGTPVSEEEVAKDLGFASVHEMHRWDTERGQEVAKLQEELRRVKGDCDQFLWSGKRMAAVLERLEAVLQSGPLDEEFRPLLIQVIQIVLGKEADWGSALANWFTPLEGEKT